MKQQLNVQGNPMFTGGGPSVSGPLICPSCYSQSTLKVKDYDQTKMVCSSCNKSFPKGECLRVQEDLRKAVGLYSPINVTFEDTPYPNNLGKCQVCDKSNWREPTVSKFGANQRAIENQCATCESLYRWELPKPVFHDLGGAVQILVCPMCQMAKFDRSVAKKGYELVRCVTCDHTYGHKTFTRKEALASLLED